MRYFSLVIPPFVALAILMILPPHSVRADGKMDVWAMIHEGKDAEVRQRLASNDLAEQRAAFDAFFTSDPVVGAFSEKLLAETPDDAKAMTARGQYLLATGWQMRGGGYRQTVFPEAAERMHRLHAEAEALAIAALAADPKLVPASDLRISVSMTMGHTAIVPDEFQRVMDLVPTRRSLLIAAYALAPQWGGSAEYGPRMCEAWADKVTDVKAYTVQICKIDVVFAANYPWELQEKALEKIGGLTHPVLDAPRLRLITNGLTPPAQQLAVFKELANSGEMTLRLAAKREALEGNAGGNVPPGMPSAAALAKYLPRMRAEADFDPGDSIALSLYTDALVWQANLNGTPFPADEVETRFGRLFAIAPYDPDTWSRFAYYRGMFLDQTTMTIEGVEAARSGFINAVYYSNNDVEFVSSLLSFNQEFWDALDKRNLDALDATGEPAFDREAFNAGVVCPTIRSVRVLDSMCEGGGARPEYCPDYSSMMGGDPRPKLIKRAEARKACAAELSADVEDLLYTAVPFDLPQ